jgi:hypothetical protein
MTVVILRENGEAVTLEGATGFEINAEKLVPTHPIEARSDEPGAIRGVIVDACRKIPISISISGVLTQTPIERAQGPASIQEFIELLEELSRESELVSIQNNFELHSNMLLSAYPRSYEAKQSATYTLLFQQVETALREIVSIPFSAPAPRASDTISDKINLGAGADKQPDPAKEKKTKSLAAGLLDSIGSLF